MFLIYIYMILTLLHYAQQRYYDRTQRGYGKSATKSKHWWRERPIIITGGVSFLLWFEKEKTNYSHELFLISNSLILFLMIFHPLSSKCICNVDALFKLKDYHFGHDRLTYKRRKEFSQNKMFCFNKTYYLNFFHV